MVSRKLHKLSRLDVHVHGKVFFFRRRVLESAKNDVVSNDMVPCAENGRSDRKRSADPPIFAWSSKRRRQQNHFQMHSTSNLGGRCKAKGMVLRKHHILSRLDFQVVGKLFFFFQLRVLESAKNDVVSNDMVP